MLHSHEELFDYIRDKDSDEVMVLGGGRVYRELLPYCDTCYITRIYESFDADTWFVNLDEMSEFEIVWQSELQEENGIQYRFLEYRRK